MTGKLADREVSGERAGRGEGWVRGRGLGGERGERGRMVRGRMVEGGRETCIEEQLRKGSLSDSFSPKQPEVSTHAGAF